MEEKNSMLALFQDGKAFEEAFAAAKKSDKKSEDLAGSVLIKFEPGEKQILGWTGTYKDILFEGQNEDKHCPIFVDEQRKAAPCAEAVIISSFSEKKMLAPGFYEIECTGEKKASAGKYKTFVIKQIALPTAAKK